MTWEFFLLTLILGSTGYALIFRFVEIKINPFLFAFIMTMCLLGTQILILAVYAFLYGVQIEDFRNVFVIAVLCGMAGASIDSGFVFMFRHGATVSVGIPLVRISTALLTVFIGLVFFTEAIDFTKGIGIVCACLGIYFLNAKDNSPKKENINV